MPHAAHKQPPRVKVRQELLLGVLVGVSMLGITGLYALTLRYQHVGRIAADSPRWSVLADGVLTRAVPIKTAILGVADAISSVAKASDAQKRAVLNLKAKILSGAVASATTTPEPETP